MRSSYTKTHLDYSCIFQTVCLCINPSHIIEFGILDGWSLDQFCKNTGSNCLIEAFDIFEEFNGNHADYMQSKKKYESDTRVRIEKADFYKSVGRWDNDTIDIIHIDIANTGDIVPYVQEYLKLLRKGGILMLEGGSLERDQINWMKKYEKTPLYPTLQKLEGVEYRTFGSIPSLTLLRKVD